ncbi:phosphotransferase [Aneurinibacillus tyrosinisolvens]|uniref:phosphotransferase n=1 Tax=Aneurinibacillus tyrosinisolvens TaxID=1443435 RepID=UPI00063EE3D3|nr:phosphotransferase [Aneurinibacillus tyrosinisolvens]
MERQAKHFLREYDATLLEMQQITGKLWRLETDRGTFALKETRESPEQLYFVANWLYFLHTAGVRSVIPFQITKYGEPYILTRQGIYMLRPWVQSGAGMELFSDWETSAITEMARIHRASEAAKEHWKGYAPVTLARIRERWKGGVSALHQMLIAPQSGASLFESAVKGSGDYVLRYAVRAVKQLDELQNKGIGEEGLALSLCHGRIHRENIIAGGNGELYFINFDRANLDTPVRDLAIFFRRYAPRRQWDSRVGMNWMRAYESVRPLSHGEKKLLACYLLYPERMMKELSRYTKEERVLPAAEQQHVYRWQKNLQMLSKTYGFINAIV